jgi:hypothetical protein
LREGLEHTIRYFDRLLSSPEPATHAIRNSVSCADTALTEPISAPGGRRQD